MPADAGQMTTIQMSTHYIGEFGECLPANNISMPIDVAMRYVETNQAILVSPDGNIVVPPKRQQSVEAATIEHRPQQRPRMRPNIPTDALPDPSDK